MFTGDTSHVRHFFSFWGRDGVGVCGGLGVEIGNTGEDVAPCLWAFAALGAVSVLMNRANLEKCGLPPR
jgi:hypothetical protein